MFERSVVELLVEFCGSFRSFFDFSKGFWREFLEVLLVFEGELQVLQEKSGFLGKIFRFLGTKLQIFEETFKFSGVEASKLMSEAGKIPRQGVIPARRCFNWL
jgi:hypothetical protein